MCHFFASHIWTILGLVASFGAAGIAVAVLAFGVPAALILANGLIFTARSHGEAIRKAERELGIPVEEMTFGPIADGFITNSGRFVSRQEAAEIAARGGQGETRGSSGIGQGLVSEHTAMSSAPPKADYQTGGTAPGLPGGNGVWGYYRSPESESSSLAAPSARGRTTPPRMDAPGEYTSAPTSALWHRSKRHNQLDASGLPDHEVRAALMKAWDQGYDAVVMRNYTTPAGEV